MRQLSLLFLLALAACALSPEERAQDAINTYGPDCVKHGHAPNTDAWRQCIQAEQQTAQNFRAQEAEVAHRRGIYCLDRINSRSPQC